MNRIFMFSPHLTVRRNPGCVLAPSLWSLLTIGLLVAALSQRVTFSSRSNFDPATDRSGKKLAYVSNRNGNLDIFATINSREESFSIHPADDYSPVFDDRGKNLAFVSRRDDSLGDVYVMDLGWSIGNLVFGREGAMRHIDLPNSEERDPVFSADGRSIIFAQRLANERSFSLATFDFKQGKAKRIPGLLGEQPAVSPNGKWIALVRAGKVYLYDLLSKAERPVPMQSPAICMQPAFDRAGEYLFLVCRVTDSNSNGRLDLEDNGALVRVALTEVVSGGGQPIFDDLSHYDQDINYPALAMDAIFYSTTTGDNLEIFSEAKSGIVSAPFDLALEVGELQTRRRELNQALRASDPNAVELALNELDTVMVDGSVTDAEFSKNRVKSHFSDPKLIAEADITEIAGKLRAKIFPRVAIGRADRDLLSNNSESIGRIKRAIDEHHSIRASIVAAQIEIAIGEVSKGSGRLDAIRSASPYLLAYADYLKVKLDGSSMGPDALVRKLVAVAIQHEKSAKVAKLAISDLSEIVFQADFPNELIVEIKQRLKPFTHLSMHLSGMLAEKYVKDGKVVLAESEYRDALSVSKNSSAGLDSVFWKLVDLLESSGRTEEAEDEVRKYEGRRKVDAESMPPSYSARIVNFWKRRATDLARNNESGMAVKRFRSAIEKDDHDIEAHRGYIDNMARRGETQRILAEYSQRWQGDPSPLNQYLFALCLTYFADSQTDLSDRLGVLEEASKRLDQAIQTDPTNPFFYHTSGWVLHQRFLLQDAIDRESEKKQGFQKFVSSAQALLRPSESGLLNRSLRMYESAERFSDGDSSLKILVKQNLAEVYEEAGNPRKSLFYGLQRISEEKRLPFRDDLEAGTFYRLAGRSAFSSDEPELAGGLYQRAVDRFESAGNQLQLAASLDALALAQRESGKYRLALRTYERLAQVQERLGDKSNRLNNDLNRAFCLAKLRQGSDAIGIVDAVEAQLRADKDLLVPPTSNEGAVVIAVDKKTASHGRFDQFMRLLLAISIRIEVAEHDQDHQAAYDLWLEKRDLIRKRRDVAKVNGLPKTYFANELAIAENNLGNLAFEAGKYQLATEHFQSSLSALDDFFDEKLGSDIDQVIAAKNALIAITASLQLEDVDPNAFKETLDRVKLTINAALEKASDAKLPPSDQLIAARQLAIQLGIIPEPSANDISERSTDPSSEGELKQSAAETEPSTNPDLSGRSIRRANRQSILADDKQAWMYYASKELWELSYAALRRTLLAGSTINSPLHRSKALEVAAKYFGNYDLAEGEVVALELATFAELWAAEAILREMPALAKRTLAETKSDDLVSLAGIRSALQVDENLLLALPMEDGFLLACLSKESVHVDRLAGIANRQLKDIPCISRSEIYAVYVVPLGGAVRILDGLRPQGSSKSVRLLPSPAWLLRPFLRQEIAVESIRVVANSSSELFAAAAGSGMEVQRVRPSGSVEDRADVLLVDGRFECNPIKGGRSFWRFETENKGSNVSMIRATDRWFKSAEVAILPHSTCFRELQNNALSDSWMVILAAALTNGIKQVVFAEPSLSSGASIGELVQLIVGRRTDEVDAKGRVIVGGARGQSPSDFRRAAESQMASTVDGAFDSFDAADYKNAIEKARRSLSYAETLGDDSVWFDMADVITKSLFALRRYDAALVYQNQIIRKKTVAGESVQIDDLISALALSIRASKVQESITLLSRIKEHTSYSEDADYAKEVARYGALVLQMERKFVETIAGYGKAKAIAAKQNDRKYVVERDLDIANVHREYLANYGEALRSYRLALDQAKTIGEVTLLARVIIDYANTLVAIASVQDAIDLLEPFVTEQLLKSNREVWIRAAQVLSVAYYQSGAFQQSKDLNSKVLHIVGDAEREPEAWLDATSLQGMLAARFGNLTEASRIFESGIQLAISRGLFSRASTRYNNMGFWSRESGNIDQSISYFERALEIDRANGIRSGEAFDLRNLGFAVLRKGQFDRARQIFGEALRLSEEIGLAINRVQTLFGIGELELRQKNYVAAKESFSKARELAASGSLRDLEWRGLAALAQMSIEQGELQQAQAMFAEAAKIIESLRSGLGSIASRSGFLADASVQDIYARWVDTLMRLNQPQQAWEVSERARARAFVDSLGIQKWKFSSPVKNELMSLEMSLRAKLTSPDPNERSQVEAEHQAVLARIRNEFPDLLQIAAVEPVTIDELTRVVPEGTALIEYMVTETGTHVWTIFKGQLNSTTLEYSKHEIERDLQTLQDLMRNVANADAFFERVGRKLIIPILAGLEGARRVAVVPHGPLHHLPFAALKIATNEYLIDRFPIHYLESATVARYVYGQRSKGNRTARMIAFGNPDVGEDLALPFAEREVRSIARTFDDTKVFVGSSATETAFKAEASSARIIHVASHGVFDMLQPVESKLMLAPDKLHDGQLKVSEIFSLAIPDSIVVLSACETGLGKITNGDEVIGMNRAFLFAGAQSLISSLWRISDVATAVLMKRFYRAIKISSDLDSALREAQIQLRQRYPHPAFWAPVRLVGNYK